jgi:hypothetical protein
MKEWWDILCDINKSNVKINYETDKKNDFLNNSDEDNQFIESILYFIESKRYSEMETEMLVRGYFSEYILNQYNCMLNDLKTIEVETISKTPTKRKISRFLGMKMDISKNSKLYYNYIKCHDKKLNEIVNGFKDSAIKVHERMYFLFTNLIQYLKESKKNKLMFLNEYSILKNGILPLLVYLNSDEVQIRYYAVNILKIIDLDYSEVIKEMNYYFFLNFQKLSIELTQFE